MYRTSKTYEALYAYCETVPVIDTHDHSTKLGPRYTDPIQVVIGEYFLTDLASATSDAHTQTLLNHEVPWEERWPILERAWSRTCHTGFAQVTRRVLKEFYGEDDVTLDALHRMADKLLDLEDQAAFEEILLDWHVNKLPVVSAANDTGKLKAMKRESKSKTHHEIHYAHGHNSAHSQKMLSSRTAQVHAAFFLPHLHAGMKLLDCGCGSGSITLGLADVVAPGQVTGIDIALSELDRARTSANQQGTQNTHFERGDLFELAFADATFDAVFCHNVLEHLDNPHRALAEMVRVLKPGGVIGLRDCDIGGKMLYPCDNLVEEWFALYEADWCAVAGDSRFGRRLPGLVRAFGFRPLKVSASYDVYGDRESIQFISQIGASRCEEADFMQRVIENGLVSPQKLKAMRDAWLTWVEDPAAFVAIAHTDIVGWKP